VTDPIDPAWEVAVRALAEIPAGGWTTYGDVAALTGTHPIAVGSHLANHPVPNVHRVLQSDGRVSPNFRWTDGRTEPAPRTLLEAEGVVFDDRDRADPQQRLNAKELADLGGVTLDALPESLPELPADEYLTRFTEQLAAAQATATVNAVVLVLDAWRSLGGTLWLGKGNETSCSLIAREGRNSLWPVVLHPSGKCEVVFQYMATRPPFDDIELRQEFQNRLNKIAGVNLPEAKLELRPGFPLELLTDEPSRQTFIDTLAWFHDQANPADDRISR
jgi:alkylated DNA nucleotide flippase Atl1